jgi:hypothetical protein
VNLEELVQERRKDIQDSAPCVGCGSTLATCKRLRGTDPTAPPWFGCCARGMGLAPCQHVPDPQALIGLLKEIESGRVRTVDEVLLDSLTEFSVRRGVSRFLADFDEASGRGI